MSHEVRRALAGAGAAAVASAEEAGAGAEEGAAVTEAEAVTGKENYSRAHNDIGKRATWRGYMR